MRTKPLFVICIFLAPVIAFSQNGNFTANELPSFTPPTPEASGIIKADNLTVGYSTGSPNINIPLYTLEAGSYKLPISLNYSSTGIKVDDYASMVGMGWNVNFGGLVSRTVFDQPDELRQSNNCNLNTYNFSNPGWAELNFLKNSTDKQSDIFTFSFPGGSGKFVLDINLQPVLITKQNLKIQVVNGSFLNGFIITTDDGTDYYFQDAEISDNRNPTGQNCEKIFDGYDEKTSWYLTKIVLPSRQKEINFTYTTASITFLSSITQTISRVTYSESYPASCPGGPTGTACPLGTERFSICIPQQTVISKFITKIETNDGDKIEFYYDATLRSDLQNGKRLSSIKVTNRSGNRLRNIVFTGSYRYAINSSGYAYTNNRLFLQSLSIQGAGASSATELQYQFTYDDYDNLPGRLTMGQDFYGYYNGKNNNPSLIPILNSTDVNYSTFNNGTGATLVQFGDRSIDINYSKKGLLTKIVYPTKGYDIITYAENYIDKNPTGTPNEVLAGGHSISAIASFTDNNVKVLEKQYVYRNKIDNRLSSFRLTDYLLFSQLNQIKKDGYSCDINGFPYVTCVGPQCNYAVVTSNTNHPLTTFGSQHLYFKAVQEIVKGTNTDNGITEHKYSYFGGGNLTPQHLMGDFVLSAPFQIVPDILIGETETNVFKNTGSQYLPVKTTVRAFSINGLTEYKNYIVKKNYVAWQEAGPGNTPLPCEIEAYDVDATYINMYTVRLDNTVEKDYTDAGQYLTKTTYFEYNNPAYTYPTRIRTTESDGLESKVERKYPPDYTGSPSTGMIARNIISPVIEETNYKNNVLLTTKTATYLDWFTNGNLYVPQTIDLKIKSNTQTQKIQVFDYDEYGNAKSLAKENDQRFYYIWDYKNNYPVAKIQLATPDSVAYTSFESNGTGRWNYSGLVFTDGSAPTGRKVYNLGTGNITKSGLSTLTTYYVTYWSKNGQQSVSGSSTITTLRINGSWTCFEHKVVNPSGGTITVSGSGAIDELRLLPDKAFMTTTTYDPMIGITSQCAANNLISYYEYDEFDRLILIRDINRNILKKVCYNYSGQTEDNCPLYYNVPTSGVYTKECTSGYTGSAVTYTVPAGTYSSTLSIDDANAKAQADVTANGQAYANALGTCTASCSFSMNPGYNLVTSSISASGGTASFYIVFYPTSTMSPGNTYIVATINGGCRPSATRTINYSASGRSWTITIYPNGQMYWYLQYGSTPVNPYSTVGTSTLTYNL